MAVEPDEQSDTPKAPDPEQQAGPEPVVPDPVAPQHPQPAGIGVDGQALAPAAPVLPPTPGDPWVAPPSRRRWYASEAGWLRVVIVVWCVWLLGAWAAAWLSDTSVPRVRWMLFAGSFGLMLAWPAFRLSERVRQPGIGRSTGVVLLDWLALVGVYQAVIWSLNLIAFWPFMRGLWLDLVVLAWSLLSALIVAAARLWPGIAARVIGMVLCIALVFAEPVLIWVSLVSGGEGWSMRVSPIQAMWQLTEPPNRSSIAPWDQRTMTVGLIAVAGWMALGIWALGERLTRRAAK